MRKEHLKPVSGLIVRDPRNAEPLPAKGKTVDMTSYWLRRLKEGSVEIVKPTRAKTKSRAQKASEE